MVVKESLVERVKILLNSGKLVLSGGGICD